MVCHGLPWFAMVWQGLEWFGMVLHGLDGLQCFRMVSMVCHGLHGLAGFGLVSHKFRMVWLGFVRFNIAWLGRLLQWTLAYFQIDDMA